MKALFLFLIFSLTLAAQPKISQHMMLFETTGTEIHASESIIIDGMGKGKLQVMLPNRPVALVPMRSAMTVHSRSSELIWSGQLLLSYLKP